MSDHEQQQIADLTERLLATREQREDWAKFALDMQRERDAARQEVRTLAAERDEARREFAEWLDASRKALATHAEVVAERDEARRVRTRWLLGGHVPTRTRAGAGGGMRRWEYHCEAGSYDCVTLLGLLREIFSHRWWHWRRGDGWVD